ncbi:hypothetical protein GCM10010234_79290 [Streptomyces hawaiiensis]
MLVTVDQSGGDLAAHRSQWTSCIHPLPLAVGSGTRPTVGDGGEVALPLAGGEAVGDSLADGSHGPGRGDVVGLQRCVVARRVQSAPIGAEGKRMDGVARGGKRGPDFLT